MVHIIDFLTIFLRTKLIIKRELLEKASDFCLPKNTTFLRKMLYFALILLTIL